MEFHLAIQYQQNYHQKIMNLTFDLRDASHSWYLKFHYLLPTTQNLQYLVEQLKVELISLDFFWTIILISSISSSLVICRGSLPTK